MKLIAIAIICLFVASNAQQYYGNSDAVLLEQVRALTFATGQWTNGRRSSPIPQLQCVGGSAQGQIENMPKSVQCQNVGSDGFGNVQWKCEADLDSSVRFGQTTVNCEGYTYPDDPYILKGSCGLEYTLDLTEQGRQNKGQAFHSTPSYHTNYYGEHKGFSWGNVVMILIFCVIIFGLVRQCTHNTTNSSSYSSVPHSDSYNTGYYQPPVYPSASSSSWRPGFWSGLGAGGLLSHFFRPRTYGQTYGHNNTFGNNYGAPSFRSSGSFGSTTTSSPRTASAFASTKRR